MAGINVAGKHVPLHTARGDGPHSLVKLILKDLPLHKVSNNHVLAEVKKHGEVLSEVKYSNIWVDGKRTHLCNGDHFLYVSPASIDKIPKHIFIRTFRARVMKLPLYSVCFQCG